MDVDLFILGIQSTWVFVAMGIHSMRLRSGTSDDPIINLLMLGVAVSMFVTSVIAVITNQMTFSFLMTSYLLTGIVFATIRYYGYRYDNWNKEPTFGMFLLFLWRAFFWGIYLKMDLIKQVRT